MAEDNPTLSQQTNPEAPTLGPTGSFDTTPIESFGDYELIAEIARGGMGVVLRARQIGLNRAVAVKMLLAGVFASDTERERFRHESEAAAGLEHPHILPIYEVGEHAGRAFFSMKLVAGGTLAEKLANKPRPSTREFVELLAKICRAVDHAHRRGILHRDLKPSNVLLDEDGTPFVADFGLAKKTDGDDLLTHTGAVLGTPSYMAPEQARGEKGLTTAADIYSLAAILYEILAGRPPFVGETMMSTLRKVIDDTPLDPRSIAPAADRDLSVVALKGLAKEPARRYATAAALADDLDRWLRGEAVMARPMTRSERAVRWVRKNRGLTALGASLAAALVVGTFLSTLFAIRANRQKDIADRNASDVKLALIDAGRAKDAAQTEREKAEDSLCRSRYEEARALRLAGIPGWRGMNLDRLRDAAQLRTRPRDSNVEHELPAIADLRGEAIVTLRRNDAVLVRSIPSGLTDDPILSGDGKLLISKFNRTKQSGMTFGVRGLDLKTGAEAFSHEMDFSPNKIGDMAPAKIGDMANEKEQQAYARRMGFFSGSMAVNSLGTQAICGLFAVEFSLVDLRTAKELRPLKTTLAANSGFLSGQALSNDDRRAVAWGHEDKVAATLLLWDMEKDAPARALVRVPLTEEAKLNPKAVSPQFGSSHACGFTPRGHVWYVPPDRGSVRVLDPAATESHETRYDIPDVAAVAWHPSEPILAALTHRDGKALMLVLWDCIGQKEIARQLLTENRRPQIPFYSGFVPMAFSRDGRFLAVRGDDTSIEVLDAKTGKEFLHLPIGAVESIMKLGWTADNELFVKPVMEAIQLWHIGEERELQQSLELGSPVNVARLSPDQRYWVLAKPPRDKLADDGKPQPNALSIRDQKNGARVPLPDQADVRSIRFRPDSRAVVMQAEKDVVEISLPDGREVRRVAMPKLDGFTGWDAPIYLPSGKLVCQLIAQEKIDNTKQKSASDKEGEAPFTIWDVDQFRILWQNPELSGCRLMGNYTCMSHDSALLVLNPNKPFFFLGGADHERTREPLWVIDLVTGKSPGRILLGNDMGGDTLPQSVSPDNRWLAVVDVSLSQGGLLAIGEMSIQIHKLPSGEVVLRRTTKVSDDDLGGGFAQTIPFAAILADKSTLELWRLEPAAELIARWQPFGGKKIADVGFTGDTLYLRCEGQTKLDLMPLPDLNRRLQTLGLEW